MRILQFSKQVTCDACPIKDKCPHRTDGGIACEEMHRVYTMILRKYQYQQAKFSELGLVKWIARLEAELAILPRVSERYKDIIKLLKDHYVELHEMTYGRKSINIDLQAKVDVNKMVKAAMESDEEVVNEKGETVMVIKKEKKKVKS